MYDAIVIGGGIVGVSLAYHLVSSGAKTLLADRGGAGRATNAGAGILTPELHDGMPAAQFDMAVAANDYYPALIAQLAELGAGETGYATCGQLSVVVSDDELAPFTATRQAEFGYQRSPAAAAYIPHELAPEQAHALFPALAPVSNALYYPKGARVDGRLLSEALRRAAIGRGLVVQQAGAERLIVAGDTVSGVVIDGVAQHTAAVAIAGGAWSPEWSSQLGVTILVVPQRGQIAHLRLANSATGEWPIVSGFRGHYIVSWPGGRVVAGASRESGAGFAAHTTAVGVHNLLGEALRVAPGLAAAQLGEIRVGLRPTSADGLPILGSVPPFRNVYLATGHGPHGLQLGPYSGKLVAELMLGQAREESVAAFGVARFGGVEKQQ